MKKTYSLYETKAKLSAIIRQVREGGSVTVTVHGEPVAEIRPVTQRKVTFEERLKELEAQGIIVPSNKPFTLRTIARRPGALKRFLEDRNK